MSKYLSRSLILITVLVHLFLLVGVPLLAQRSKTVAQAKLPKIPDVIVLAGKAKNGPVRFNHVKHNGGEYNADGPILCIQCHHTAQPAVSLTGIPPHRTVWPSDRTTTLTSELFAADPKNAGVASCRDCHARQGAKPKMLEFIPVIKDPETERETLIDNQNAFHTACDVCHFEIGFRTKGSKAPAADNCASCHKPASPKPKRRG
ncbi:MAG: cytochrome c3 family protein [Acidobacteria bacterium]|nr:cytochrome c3 family protein [Acidobacteriota bacterium]